MHSWQHTSGTLGSSWGRLAWMDGPQCWAKRGLIYVVVLPAESAYGACLGIPTHAPQCSLNRLSLDQRHYLCLSLQVSWHVSQHPGACSGGPARRYSLLTIRHTAPSAQRPPPSQGWQGPGAVGAAAAGVACGHEWPPQTPGALARGEPKLCNFGHLCPMQHGMQGGPGTMSTSKHSPPVESNQ